MVKKNKSLLKSIEIDKRDLEIIKQELELTELNTVIEKLKATPMNDLLKRELNSIMTKLSEINKESVNLSISSLSSISTQNELRDLINDNKGLIIENQKNIDDFKNNINENFILKINQQQKEINEFKNSIIYPLYRITYYLGKTQLGKMLVKLFK